MSLSIKVKPGEKVRLADIDTDGDSGLSKEQADERLGELSRQLGKLQELLSIEQARRTASHARG